MNEASDRHAIFRVLAAAALWGCWSLFLRPTGLSGFVTGPVLCAGVAALMTPHMLGERVTHAVVWTRPLLIALGVYSVADAINIATFFQSMSTTSVAVAVLTHSIAPILVSLFAPWIEGTTSSRAPAAAAAAVCGLALVLEPWRDLGQDPNLLPGAALGLASALGYAATVFAAKRLSASVGPATALVTHAWLAAALLLPFAGLGLLEIELVDLGWLGLATLLPGSVAGYLFVQGLRVIGSARASVLALLEPLVACIVGYLAYGERLSALATLGGALVVGAAAYVALESSTDTLSVTRANDAG